MPDAASVTSSVSDTQAHVDSSFAHYLSELAQNGLDSLGLGWGHTAKPVADTSYRPFLSCDFGTRGDAFSKAQIAGIAAGAGYILGGGKWVNGLAIAGAAFLVCRQAAATPAK